MTYDHSWLPILRIRALHLPIQSAHTQPPEQWAAIYATAPWEQLGVRCLAHPQFLPARDSNSPGHDVLIPKSGPFCGTSSLTLRNETQFSLAALLRWISVCVCVCVLAAQQVAQPWCSNLRGCKGLWGSLSGKRIVLYFYLWYHWVGSRMPWGPKAVKLYMNMESFHNTPFSPMIRCLELWKIASCNNNNCGSTSLKGSGCLWCKKEDYTAELLQIQAQSRGICCHSLRWVEIAALSDHPPFSLFFSLSICLSFSLSLSLSLFLSLLSSTGSQVHPRFCAVLIRNLFI